MAEKLYTLKLTKAELWELKEAFNASFTDIEGRPEIVVQLSDRLDALYRRAWRAKDTTAEE